MVEFDLKQQVIFAVIATLFLTRGIKDRTRFAKMCLCYKFSAKYNRWWTAFFHVHCFACFLCLLALLFFGRLVFDDLDKRQFIHLSIHIAIVACLFALQAGNRCSIPRLYFVYFIGYHVLLLANIGLETYSYYTTPHHVDKSLFEPTSNNETLTTTTQAPLNVTRFPNGQVSPYINMREEALYSLILICLLIQVYFTLVVYGSYKFLIDKLIKVHTLESIRVQSKNSTAINTIDLGGQPNANQTPSSTEQRNPNSPRHRWDEIFNAIRTLATCALTLVPKK